jgi:hypothetical protein
VNFRESKGTALLFFVNLGAIDGVVGQHYAPAVFTPGKTPYPFLINQISAKFYAVQDCFETVSKVIYGEI